MDNVDKLKTVIFFSRIAPKIRLDCITSITCSLGNLFSVLQITFANKIGKFDLEVTTFQMAVLFAWNERPQEKISFENLRSVLLTLCRTRGGLMVGALDSGSKGPRSNLGRGHRVVFLGKAKTTLTVPLSTKEYE